MNIVSLGIGAACNFVLVLFVSAVLPLPVPNTLEGTPALIQYLAVIGAVLAYFGYYGLAAIPIQHIGILQVFGMRLEERELHEGYWWTAPWPIMEIIPVNTKQTVINLEDFTGMTSNGIRISGKASIYYRITDPFLSLSVEEGIIDLGLHELMESALREALSEVDVDTLISRYQDAESAMTTRIRNEADRRAQQWGITIIDVKISNIKPDVEVIERYERVKKEEKEREAELTEAQGVRERMDLYQQANLSPVEARDTDQVERAKIEKKISETRIGASEEIKDIITAVTHIITQSIFTRR